MAGHTRAWLVEQMGLAAEADGFSRIAGRLFGSLLLADAPLSLDDLVRTLGVSKASVSTETRRLLDRGLLQRVGRRADRRSYYQLAPNFFAKLIEHRVQRWTLIRDLLLDYRSSRPKLPAELAGRVRYVVDFDQHVVDALRRAVGGWEARARRRAHGAT